MTTLKVRMPDHILTDDLARHARQQIVSRRIDPLLSEHVSGDLAGATFDPWLLLHHGRCLCRLHSDFVQARVYVDAAIAGFHRRDDREGELWALVEQVVLRYHEREFVHGLALLDALALDQLRPYVRAELLFGRFLCNIGLDHLHAAEADGQAALAALDLEADPWLQRIGRIQMLRNQAAAYHYLGKARLSIEAAETALALAREHPDTLDSEPWCCYELGLAYWRTGEFALAATTLDAARRLAESWRHHELWRWSVANQGHLLRDQGQLPEARAAYMLADSWGEDIHGPLLLQIREGRLADARWGCEAMITLAQRLQSPIYEADGRVMLGLVNMYGGNPLVALELFEHSIQTYTAHDYQYNLASAQYYQAAALIALGRDQAADAALRQALTFSAGEDVYTCDWWMPDMMEALLKRAAQQQIHTEHAQRFLERRFLQHAPTPMHGAERQSASTELAIARQMQLSLLPSAPPFVPDLDIAGISLPAEEVGGDFYGFYPAGADPASGVNRELGLALSDISGKGLQSALLTSGTAVAISTAVADRPAPGQLLSQVHRALYPYTARSRLYVALCYAVLAQRETGWRLSAASGGAIPPIIRRCDGSVAWLDVVGLPIGGRQAGTYTEAVTTLAPDDVVVLMSDGIIEAMNPARALFGFEQLEAALAAAPVAQGARSILTHILAAVQTHVQDADQHDDMTLIVVKIAAAAPAPR